MAWVLVLVERVEVVDIRRPSRGGDGGRNVGGVDCDARDVYDAHDDDLDDEMMMNKSAGMGRSGVGKWMDCRIMPATALLQ